MPIVLAMMFYRGDQESALALARLIADIEPKRRDDVLFLFSHQCDTAMNDEIWKAMLHVGRKMTVMSYQVPNDGENAHFSGAFNLLSNTLRYLNELRYLGHIEQENAFLFEADGCPMSKDWIDRLKDAHTETLMMGKYVTGPMMKVPNWHTNGTQLWHLPAWPNNPALHRCPQIWGWDCFHGVIIRNMTGPSQIIANPYGARDMSESVWHTYAREAAWTTSIKDGMHHTHARRLLVDKPKPWRMADATGREW
jgi:hypothetical protein